MGNKRWTLLFLLAVSILSYGGDPKVDLYRKDGIVLPLVDGWSFTGDSNFYWAADRVISAETQNFSALSLMIYRADKRDIDSINTDHIVQNILPRYMRSPVQGDATLGERAAITYGKYSGEELSYQLSGENTQVFLFEINIQNGKAFILFVASPEELSLVKSSIKPVLNGVQVDI